MKIDKRLILGLWAVAAACAITLNVANLFLGALNQDEGWYLYGARLVAEGQQPYVDFATTQGPVMTYAYALANPLVSAFGVAGGRLFTSLLGLLGTCLASWLAHRLASRFSSRAAIHAGLIAFLLIGVNVYQSYFCTIVKTYSLAGLLMVMGLLALSYIRGDATRLPALLGGVFIMLSAGTRASAVFVLPLVFLVLCLTKKGGPGFRTALWFAVGATITGLAIFLPFMLQAPESVWFAMVEYHSGRQAGNMVSLLAYKAGFLSRSILAYASAAVLGAVVVALSLTRGRWVESAGWLHRSMWLSVLVVTLVHFMAPFPYDDYQVFIYPTLAVALAVTVVRLWDDFATLLAVALLSLAMAFSSPQIHAWFVGERDRIWWPLRESPPLTVLQKTAGEIRALPGVKDDSLILTQDPYLAVETGLRLPPGLELGQFSYFSEMSKGKADVLHVLNAETFRDLLRTCDAPVAAFSGYGLSIQSPGITPLAETEQGELWELVEARYAPLKEVDPFGQADTRLRLLTRRP